MAYSFRTMLQCPLKREFYYKVSLYADETDILCINFDAKSSSSNAEMSHNRLMVEM